MATYEHVSSANWDCQLGLLCIDSVSSADVNSKKMSLNIELWHQFNIGKIVLSEEWQKEA